MRLTIPLAALALSACAASAQDPAPAGQLRSPEGAVFDTSGDLAYGPGELTEAQLNDSNLANFRQDSINVFRRFPREATEAMVKFYTEALALRSLSPIQLTATQQMILTGVGSGQIKLSAGQNGDRNYDLEGGYAGGTGIRFFMLTYPDRNVVAQRFTNAGFAAPAFTQRSDGTWDALVRDPGGFDIVIQIREGALDHSDGGVSIGVNVSDLQASRAFYREFVGLNELAPIQSAALGTTIYPYRHGESTVLLFHMGDNRHPDNASAGMQYVVNDAALAAARGAHRGIAVETPLNRLAGFDLTTVWLNDPDGVTNYFAQVGPNSRTAQGSN